MDASLLIVESDPIRRALLVAALTGPAGGAVGARDWLDPWEADRSTLVLARWDEGGTGLLARRASRIRQRRNPWLLLLHALPSPPQIGVAAADGRAEVIPADPLDLDALRNRVRLLTGGAASLARALPVAALAERPALRARLAA